MLAANLSDDGTIGILAIDLDNLDRQTVVNLRRLADSIERALEEEEGE